MFYVGRMEWAQTLSSDCPTTVSQWEGRTYLMGQRLNTIFTRRWKHTHSASNQEVRYFKRPIILGDEQPKIAISVDSTESKQKETVCSSVQRWFTLTSSIVSIILGILGTAENQHSQKEWLLDSSFPNIILLPTRKSFEAAYISLWYPENVRCFQPHVNQGGTLAAVLSGSEDLSVYFWSPFVLSSELGQLSLPT